MRAQLKSVRSPDVDLETYWPEDESCFSFPIELEIGREGITGADLFLMTVCSPGWLANENAGRTAVFGQELLIVFNYNWPMIRSHLEKRINRITADACYDAEALRSVGIRRLPNVNRQETT